MGIAFHDSNANQASKAGPPGERQRIAMIQKAAAGRFAGLVRGIGDDAAILRPRAGEEIVVTTDMLLEGVHFRRDWHSAQSAGHRCLARGLSDVAAMGARPLAAFLSVAFPAELAGAWADDFFAGLLALARQHRLPLAGGDLARSPAGVVADITVLGTVPRGQALLRSSASVGDAIYVTGELGRAAAGLADLSSGARGKHTADRTAWRKAQMFPEPRIGAGLALRRLAQKSSARIACMDLSDGLSLDLARMCEASDVSAEVDADALSRGAGVSLAFALHGGEDYELLFTAPASLRMPKALAKVPVTRIGRIVRGSRVARVSLVSGGITRPLEPLGWEHFVSREG